LNFKTNNNPFTKENLNKSSIISDDIPNNNIVNYNYNNNQKTNIIDEKDLNNQYNFELKKEFSFKITDNCPQTKDDSKLYNPNNATNSLNFQKTSCLYFDKDNNKLKEKEKNSIPNNHQLANETSIHIPDKNVLDPLIAKYNQFMGNNSNMDISHLDIARILTSKAYEGDKIFTIEEINIQKINNTKFIGKNINNNSFNNNQGEGRNSEVILNKYIEELNFNANTGKSFRENLSDKLIKRNCSKSISIANSEFSDLNNINMQNKTKLSFISNNNSIMNNNTNCHNSNTLTGGNNISHFSVLEHEEIDIKKYNRLDHGDSFCDGYFYVGLTPKLVKMIPDSENFISPCKHKNCEILNAYRPEILEYYPSNVIDGIEINSTVKKIK